MRGRYRGKEGERRGRGVRVTDNSALEKTALFPHRQQENKKLLLVLTPSLSLCLHLLNPPHQISQNKIYVYRPTTRTHVQRQRLKMHRQHGRTHVMEGAAFVTS